ncbi:MAG: NADH oxidase [Nitrospirae bacterium CG_4_9_14_0_8_um_filter_70_14]|nr:MAG: NADH oxidase [Nitrospirae bacterium CG_4_9_14_0_8_um_filter_70_14]
MEIVVIGGDAAGMSGASQIRRLQGGWPITVVERSPLTSYAACAVPYFFAGDLASAGDLGVVTPAAFREHSRIDVRTHTEVLAIDPHARRVAVRRDDGGEEAIAYDRLLLATGALPVRPTWEGVELDGVFFLRSLADSLALANRLHTGASRAVVVGGGHVGLELAEALARRGLAVTVVERAATLWGGGDPELSRLAVDELAAHRVAVRLKSAVTGLVGQGGQVVAVATEGGEIACDLCLIALGVRPNVALAAAAGIGLGESGAIAVDEGQRTDRPGVWAAGDCCEVLHRVTGRPCYLPLALAAHRAGRVAGTTMADGEARFPGVVGSLAFKCFDLAIARTGLTPAAATAAGYAPRGVTVEAESHAPASTGHVPITVTLWFDATTRRLLGGRLAGREPSVAKRCDLLAVAITTGMTVGEVADLDLTYAPPFGPVWDPLLQAAARAARECGN